MKNKMLLAFSSVVILLSGLLIFYITKKTEMPTQNTTILPITKVVSSKENREYELRKTLGDKEYNNQKQLEAQKIELELSLKDREYYTQNIKPNLIKLNSPETLLKSVIDSARSDDFELFSNLSTSAMFNQDPTINKSAKLSWFGKIKKIDLEGQNFKIKNIDSNPSQSISLYEILDTKMNKIKIKIDKRGILEKSENYFLLEVSESFEEVNQQN